MSYTRLVWRNLFRHPLRTLFTTLSIALSIFLVCAVLTLPAAMERIIARVGSSVRISVHHEAGLTYWLPFSYVHKVRELPRVEFVVGPHRQDVVWVEAEVRELILRLVVDSAEPAEVVHARDAG